MTVTLVQGKEKCGPILCLGGGYRERGGQGGAAGPPTTPWRRSSTAWSGPGGGALSKGTI